MSSNELRPIENVKTKCAKKHFQAICNNDVEYYVVDSYDSLISEIINCN